MIRLSVVAVTIFLVQSSATFVSAQPTKFADIDAYIEQGMATWSIPGLAIAIVQDDEVVFARGYGVQKLGEEARVDENTLFGVASTTKAMTAAALAMLVDEGRISWDDRVVDHLPDFRLSDPWATSQATIRDLLSHRVGVGRITGNRIQFMTHEPRSEIMHRMRHHEFEQPFRAGNVYSNVMYMVAGEIIPAVTGMKWDDFLMERIFRPIGMHRSNTSITMIGDRENAAWPHQEIEGKVVAIPRRNFDNVGPSASVNTSAREMAEWMRLQLGEPGVHDGNRLISVEQMYEMHQAQNVVRTADPISGSLSSYGLGWSLRDHRGHRIAQHGGASDGMNTNLVLVPGSNLGVVVMTNTFNGFMTALANEVLDRMLGVAQQTDWASIIRGNYERAFERAAARRTMIEAGREMGTRPSVPESSFTGAFVDSLYGEVVVAMADGAMRLEFWNDHTLVADLEHWHHDTYRATWRNPAQREKFVWFTRDADGEPNTLNVEFTLRPVLLQVGTYPSDYSRIVRFRRADAPADGMAGRGR
jgi:CubicO group peptidase (beta-lactamase class C family)